MSIRAISALTLLAFSCADDSGSTPTATSNNTAPSSGSTSFDSTTAPSTGADTTANASGSSTSASGPSTGVPTSTTDFTTGDSSGGMGMAGVYARYEVRDNAGMPVEVWATPICAPDPFECNTIGPDWGPVNESCMTVFAVGQSRVGIRYEVSSGLPEPCYEDNPVWADATAYWFDAACTIPAMFPKQIEKVAGTLYYGSGEQATTDMVYSGGPAACSPAGAFPSAMSPAVPVPPEILGILPDAPYEIAIAY